MRKKKKFYAKKLTNEEKAAKLTNKILKQMEEDEVIPWHKPWNTFSGRPQNFSTKSAYNGVNIFLLAMANFESPHWLGYGQARDMGGHVKKEEKGTAIYRPFTYSTKEDKEAAKETGEDPRKRTGFTTETVFNASQIAGIEFPKLDTIEFNNIEAAEKLSAHMIGQMGIDVTHGKRQACYLPEIDRVDMPNKENFHSEPHYYSTLFHELAHASGHHSRLDRGLTANHDADRYGVEELRAELTANYLRSLVGIESPEQDELSVAYLKSWSEKIKSDPEMFITASKDAFEIAEYMTEGFELDKEVEVTRKPAEEEKEEEAAPHPGLLPGMPPVEKGDENAPEADDSAKTEPAKVEDLAGVAIQNSQISEPDPLGRQEFSFEYTDKKGWPREGSLPLARSEVMALERYQVAFPDRNIEATMPIEDLNSFRAHDIGESPTLAEVAEDPQLIPELPEAKEEQIEEKEEKIRPVEIDLDM